MFCVLLNTGQTLNQSLAVQDVAFTNDFNLQTISTSAHSFLENKVALQSGHSFLFYFFFGHVAEKYGGFCEQKSASE